MSGCVKHGWVLKKKTEKKNSVPFYSDEPHSKRSKFILIAMEW